MKYKTEFHIHTRGSKDSILSYLILLIQCKINKIDCIAITDHNEVNWAIKHKESFEKRIADTSDCYDFEEIDNEVESL